MFALIVCLSTGFTVCASSDDLWDSYTVPSTRQKDRLLDNADLLSSSEEAELLRELDDLSEKQRCNVVILTVDSHSGSIEAFADDYFDYNGFGADYDDAGVLFMLSMETREWAISTSGAGISAFTDYGQEVMTDKMLPYLKDGDYYNAFKTYIDRSDYYLDLYHEGTPFDIQNNKEKTDPLFHIFLSIVIGLVTAIIPILAMKSKLKTVRINNSASEYRTHEGINLQVHRDHFISSNVTKMRKAENNNSSRGGLGGSSIHTSSSGHSHGGSHGHF